ncbi:MAG TPA: hypothetical protein VFK02_12185 [Kofleriaceae bacterium]|nr:hypothetical protein [Kofleriaceae bacterium]
MAIQPRRAASTSPDPRVSARELFEALDLPGLALAIVSTGVAISAR